MRVGVAIVEWQTGGVHLTVRNGPNVAEESTSPVFIEITGLLLTQLACWKKRGVVRLLGIIEIHDQLANMLTGGQGWTG